MVSGGYRRPTNPAPVSGPGRLSKRTDGGPSQKLMVAPGLAYGERQETLAQERTAPMAQADPIAAPPMPANASTPGGAQRAAAPQGMNFSGASQRPNEPITHGVNIGPGGGTGVLPATVQAQSTPAQPITNMLRSLSATSTSGSLAQLYQAAMTRGV